MEGVGLVANFVLLLQPEAGVGEEVVVELLIVVIGQLLAGRVLLVCD